MTIDVLVMTDGRGDYLRSTMASLAAQVLPSLDGAGERVIHDDSGQDEYGWWLADTFGPAGWQVITTGRRSGFGQAYRNAWAWATINLRGDYLFSTEDDFMFNRPVNLPDMAGVLERRPELAQLALRRQAWNEAEKTAGGVVELNPDAFTPMALGPHRWLEHRLFWTTNPSLHRRSLCAVGWPGKLRQSEGVWTHMVLADPAARFGYWGEASDPPWVDHIGHQRTGKGY